LNLASASSAVMRGTTALASSRKCLAVFMCVSGYVTFF
jgi:hypothetical protein